MRFGALAAAAGLIASIGSNHVLPFIIGMLIFAADVMVLKSR